MRSGSLDLADTYFQLAAQQSCKIALAVAKDYYDPAFQTGDHSVRKDPLKALAYYDMAFEKPECRNVAIDRRKTLLQWALSV